MINHDKQVSTLSIMLSEIKFNQKRHNDRNWQKSKKDKLSKIYEDEVEALEYAIGVLTQKICFAGREW